MTPILQGLAQGYSGEEILKFITRAFPKLAPKVAQATASGYSIDQVLKYINKLTETETFPKGLSSHEIEARHQKKYNDIGKKILGTAATATGVTAAVKNLPKIIKGAVSGIGPSPMSNAPVSPPSIGGAPTQVPLPPQAVERKEALDKLSAATPEFKAYASEQIEKGEDKSTDELLKDFQKQQMSQKKKSELMKGIESDVAKMESPTKLEKGSIVATPNGEVGELKSVRNKEALVDDQGKLHKLKIKDLQLPDEKVQQTVARLLEIPEIDKSSLINYWSYDPEDKELFLMFHNGETYKYLDVPEELETELSEAAISPRTKGENEFGAWSQEDPSSRGATFIQKLIAHPKYKKPGKGESLNPFYRKLRKGYDYWTSLRKQ